MEFIWQEFFHLLQQKSYRFCSWEITVFEQNWKIILFLRIKSGPGPQRDCRLKDWNPEIFCENSPRAIHSDFRSSFVSHLNTAVFKLNPISLYHFNHWQRSLVQPEVYRVPRVTYKVVAVLTWCQFCTTAAAKGEGCSYRPDLKYGSGANAACRNRFLKTSPIMWVTEAARYCFSLQQNIRSDPPKRDLAPKVGCNIST